MLAIPRLAVFVFLTVVGLVGIPMAFCTPGNTLPDAGTWAPVYLVFELVIYFTLTLFGNPRMSLSSVFLLAIIMAGVRAVGSIIGFAISSLLGAEAASAVLFYAGNPLSVFLQGITIVLATPHIMAAALPGQLDKSVLNRLRGQEAPLPESGRPGHSVDTNPTGGFIQVFSYEELAGIVRKTQGLEGFIITNHEGLIVWRDLPLRIEADELSARLMAQCARVGTVVDDGGLSRLKRLIVETRDHKIGVVELNANFGLILIYGSRASMSESDSRMSVVARTTREFLQWKYPGLAVT